MTANKERDVDVWRGVFVSYRRGRHTQRNRQVLVRIEGVRSGGEAASFIGRKAILKIKTGKKIIGKVVALHGRGGVVRCIFRNGLPGQELSSQIEIR